MPVDPRQVFLYCPPGLRKFKQELFDRIGGHIKAKGGNYTRHNLAPFENLSADVIPIVGCMPECTDMIATWRAAKRPFIYFDRGYARRVFATWLPKGDSGGYYRWHVGSFQTQKLREVPDDRWKKLDIQAKPWAKNGKHIVIAAPSRTYCRFHRCETWIADTIDALARVTDRQLVIRDKEHKRPLQFDLDGAHALVTHGSIAAVESVVLGCPVFVHPDSAAALVGLTDLSKIERPVYPDREPWFHSLAYDQFSERELVDGTLWRLMT